MYKCFQTKVYLLTTVRTLRSAEHSLTTLEPSPECRVLIPEYSDLQGTLIKEHSKDVQKSLLREKEYTSAELEEASDEEEEDLDVGSLFG